MSTDIDRSTPTPGALAPVAKKQLATIKDMFTAAGPSFANVLPKHLTPERLTKVALACVGARPELLACTPVSLVRAVMVAAQLGLEAGGVLGEAYLVPYKTTCTLIPGYRGLIALARRSGQIESIEAHVVRKRDRFVVRYGLNPTLEHEPNLDHDPDNDDPFELGEESARAFYAIARLKGGGTQFDVMSKAEVDAIRRRSAAANRGPWVTDYEEMGKKTVIRRLSKTLPMSVEYSNALVLQANAEAGTAGYAGLSEITIPFPEDGNTIDADDAGNGNGNGSAAAGPSKTEDVKERIRKKRSDAGKPRGRRGEELPDEPAGGAAAEPAPAENEPPIEAAPAESGPAAAAGADEQTIDGSTAAAADSSSGGPGRPERHRKAKAAPEPAAEPAERPVNELTEEELASPEKLISIEKARYIDEVFDAAELSEEAWAEIMLAVTERYGGTRDVKNGEFTAIVLEINRRADEVHGAAAVPGLF